MAASIGTHIVELRSERGLSQEALANELGLSRQAVSRWERGEALPDTENLIALADLFDVSLDELVWPQRRTEREDAGEATDGNGTDENAEGEREAESERSEGETEDGPEAQGGLSPEHAEVETEARADLPPDYVTDPEGAQPDATPACDAANAAEPEAPAEADGDAPDCPPTLSLAMQQAALAPEPLDEPKRRPKRLKTALLVIFACIALLALAAGALISAYRFFAFEPSAGANAEQSLETELLSVDVDGPKVKAIALDWKAGNVSIEPIDDQETATNVRLVEVAHGPHTNDSSMLTWTLNDGLLTIEATESSDMGHDLLIYLPTGVMGQLEKVSLDVLMTNLEAFGLTCKELEATVYGSLFIEDGQISRVSLAQEVGYSRIMGNFGDLDLTVDTGEAMVACTSAPTSVSTDLRSSLELLLPDDCGFTLTGNPNPSTISTDQLRVEFPLVHGESSSVHGDGKVPISVNVGTQVEGILVIEPLSVMTM